jgi:hypothetical protein
MKMKNNFPLIPANNKNNNNKSSSFEDNDSYAIQIPDRISRNNIKNNPVNNTR